MSGRLDKATLRVSRIRARVRVSARSSGANRNCGTESPIIVGVVRGHQPSCNVPTVSPRSTADHKTR